MSQSWAMRIGEGLVIGVSASVMFLVFNSMNDAREELTTTRETLEIQLDVNQDLVDKTESLQDRMNRLDRRIDEVWRSHNDDVPTTGSVPDFLSGPPLEVEPTSSFSGFDLPEPVEVNPEVSTDAIRQRILEQRSLREK